MVSGADAVLKTLGTSPIWSVGSRRSAAEAKQSAVELHRTGGSSRKKGFMNTDTMLDTSEYDAWGLTTHQIWQARLIPCAHGFVFLSNGRRKVGIPVS